MKVFSAYANMWIRRQMWTCSCHLCILKCCRTQQNISRFHRPLKLTTRKWRRWVRADHHKHAVKFPWSSDVSNFVRNVIPRHKYKRNKSKDLISLLLLAIIWGKAQVFMTANFPVSLSSFIVRRLPMLSVGALYSVSVPVFCCLVSLCQVFLGPPLCPGGRCHWFFCGVCCCFSWCVSWPSSLPWRPVSLILLWCLLLLFLVCFLALLSALAAGVTDSSVVFVAAFLGVFLGPPLCPGGRCHWFFCGVCCCFSWCVSWPSSLPRIVSLR